MILRLILLSFLSSCGTSSVLTPKQELSPNKIYKRDMLITSGDSSGEGTLVLPLKNSYKIRVEAAGNLDMFTLETCHRSWEKQKAWNVATKKKVLFWKKTIDHKNRVEFEFKPSEKFEKNQYCPVRLGGYEIKLGRHSWGFIDFETSDSILPAKVYCDGREYQSNGVTICQAREGLVQAIEFKNEVEVSPEANCSLGKTKGKLFEYNIKRGRCVYAFKELSGDSRVHRLTTIGFEKVLIRE